MMPKLYAFMPNGVIETIREHPDHRRDDGEKLTDAELAEQYWYVVFDALPSYDGDTQRLITLPHSEWLLIDGVVYPQYVIEDIEPELMRRSGMSMSIFSHGKIVEGEDSITEAPQADALVVLSATVPGPLQPVEFGIKKPSDTQQVAGGLNAVSHRL